MPLHSDSGVLGAGATSDTPHTIVDIPNGYIVHLLSLIESLSKPALVTLAKDPNISESVHIICLVIVYEILYRLTGRSVYKTCSEFGHFILVCIVK